MASDIIIDFQTERGRHEELLGREDVMAELDALLLGGPSRGWVLVKGGPGMGKSALLAEWLKRCEEAGHPVPAAPLPAARRRGLGPAGGGQAQPGGAGGAFVPRAGRAGRPARVASAGAVATGLG